MIGFQEYIICIDNLALNFLVHLNFTQGITNLSPLCTSMARFSRSFVCVRDKMGVNNDAFIE